MDANTDNTTVQPGADASRKSENIIRSSKYFLCGINAVVMLVYTCISKSYNLMGIGCAIAILGLLYARLRGSNPQTSASTFLPSFIMADICCIIGLHWKEFKDAYDAGFFNGWYYLRGFGGAFLWILLIGGVVALIGYSKPQLAWLSGVGGGTICASLTLWMWSNQDMANLQLMEEGTIFLSFVVGFSILWTFIEQFIAITHPQYISEVHGIGFALVCLFFAFAVVGGDYARTMADVWTKTLVGWADFLSSWYIVIFSAMILLLLATCVQDGEGYLSIDCMACASVASIIVAMWLLKVFPFALSIFLLIALMCLTLKWVANGKAQRKTFGIDNFLYYSIQFGVFVLSAILLHNGLWTSFIALIVYGIIFNIYREYHENYFWILMLLGLATFTVSWLFKFRLSADGIKVLTLVLAVSVLAVLLVGRKQPGDERGPVRPRCAVCGVMAILCLLLMGHGGSRISAGIPENNCIGVRIEARGKGNVITQAEAVWCDKFGNPVSDPISLSRGEKRLWINGELLRIVAVDDNGIRTTSDFLVGG